MSERISIDGLDKAAVLAALYNAARAQGLGFIHYDSTPMSPEEAQKKYGNCDDYYDYIQGRVMKVDLSDDSFDPWLYDSNNGSGVAKMVIDILTKDGDTNPIESMITHTQNTKASEKDLKEMIKEEPGYTGEEEEEELEE